MDLDNQQLNKFLKEGEAWFKKHHLPQFFPAFIAQIPEAINKFSESIAKHAESNEKLSKSIKYATWLAGSVALVALIWDMFKTFILKN